MLILKWQGFTEFDLKEYKTHCYYKTPAPALPDRGTIVANRLTSYFYACFEHLKNLNDEEIIKMSEEIRDYFSYASELIIHGHTGELVIDEFPGYGSLNDWDHVMVLDSILYEYFDKESLPENYYYVLSIMLIHEAFRLTGDNSNIAAIDAIGAYYTTSIPAIIKNAASERARTAAKARHKMNQAMKDEVIRIYKNNSYKSMKNAAEIIFPLVQDFANKKDIRGLTNSSGEETVYRWIRDHNKID